MGTDINILQDDQRKRWRTQKCKKKAIKKSLEEECQRLKNAQAEDRNKDLYVGVIYGYCIYEYFRINNVRKELNVHDLFLCRSTRERLEHTTRLVYKKFSSVDSTCMMNVSISLFSDDNAVDIIVRKKDIDAMHKECLKKRRRPIRSQLVDLMAGRDKEEAEVVLKEEINTRRSVIASSIKKLNGNVG